MRLSCAAPDSALRRLQAGCWRVWRERTDRNHSDISSVLLTGLLAAAVEISDLPLSAPPDIVQCCVPHICLASILTVRTIDAVTLACATQVPGMPAWCLMPDVVPHAPDTCPLIASIPHIAPFPLFAPSAIHCQDLAQRTDTNLVATGMTHGDASGSVTMHFDSGKHMPCVLCVACVRSITWSPAQKATNHCRLSRAGIPLFDDTLTPFVPNVRADLTITFWSSCDNSIQYNVAGVTSGFPAFELYINHALAYR